MTREGDPQITEDRKAHQVMMGLIQSRESTRLCFCVPDYLPRITAEHVKDLFGSVTFPPSRSMMDFNQP